MQTKYKHEFWHRKIYYNITNIQVNKIIKFYYKFCYWILISDSFWSQFFGIWLIKCKDSKY